MKSLVLGQSINEKKIKSNLINAAEKNVILFEVDDCIVVDNDSWFLVSKDSNNKTTIKKVKKEDYMNVDFLSKFRPNKKFIDEFEIRKYLQSTDFYLSNNIICEDDYIIFMFADYIAEHKPFMQTEWFIKFSNKEMESCFETNSMTLTELYNDLTKNYDSQWKLSPCCDNYGFSLGCSSRVDYFYIYSKTEGKTL